MKKFRYICLIICLLLLLSACAANQSISTAEESSQGPTWQEQYDLGVRYLSESNYQEAIIAFTAAIELDPKQAPAYLGRGDAYVLSGETEEIWRRRWRTMRKPSNWTRQVWRPIWGWRMCISGGGIWKRHWTF